MQVLRLAREMKHLTLDLGTSVKPRSVCDAELALHGLVSVLTGHCELVGDIHFEAPRRFWTQTTRAPNYAYLLTDPQPGADPALGVSHGSVRPYLFENLSTTVPPKVANLSRMMLDYWISFAVSLTPNDGKGTNSTL